MGGSLKECEALRCVRQRGYAGCWDCADREDCGKLAFQRASYGETIAGNFSIIREHGVEGLTPRGGKYYEWQRKLGAV